MQLAFSSLEKIFSIIERTGKETSKEITIIKPAIPDLGDVDEVEVIEVCVEVGQKVESGFISKWSYRLTDNLCWIIKHW